MSRASVFALFLGLVCCSETAFIVVIIDWTVMETNGWMATVVPMTVARHAKLQTRLSTLSPHNSLDRCAWETE